MHQGPSTHSIMPASFGHWNVQTFTGMDLILLVRAVRLVPNIIEWICHWHATSLQPFKHMKKKKIIKHFHSLNLPFLRCFFFLFFFFHSVFLGISSPSLIYISKICIVFRRVLFLRINSLKRMGRNRKTKLEKKQDLLQVNNIYQTFLPYLNLGQSNCGFVIRLSSIWVKLMFSYQFGNIESGFVLPCV